MKLRGLLVDQGKDDLEDLVDVVDAQLKNILLTRRSRALYTISETGTSAQKGFEEEQVFEEEDEEEEEEEELAECQDCDDDVMVDDDVMLPDKLISSNITDDQKTGSMYHHLTGQRELSVGSFPFSSRDILSKAESLTSLLDTDKPYSEGLDRERFLSEPQRRFRSYSEPPSQAPCDNCRMLKEKVAELEAELVSAENRILFLNDETQIVKEQLSNLDTGYCEESESINEVSPCLPDEGIIKRIADGTLTVLKMDTWKDFSVLITSVTCAIVLGRCFLMWGGYICSRYKHLNWSEYFMSTHH